MSINVRSLIDAIQHAGHATHPRSQGRSTVAGETMASDDPEVTI